MFQNQLRKKVYIQEFQDSLLLTEKKMGGKIENNEKKKKKIDVQL